MSGMGRAILLEEMRNTESLCTAHIASVVAFAWALTLSAKPDGSY